MIKNVTFFLCSTKNDIIKSYNYIGDDMNYIDDVIISVIFLLFPLLVYLFYIAYNKNINAEENNMFLGLSLFFSIYLIFYFNSFNYPRINIYIANVIIIIAYILNKPKEAILLSIINIFVISNRYNLNVYISIIEYIIYFYLYYKSRNNIDDYEYASISIMIKTIFLNIFNNNVYSDNIFITVIIAILIYILIIFLLRKGEAIIEYHSSYKELIKEKEIKNTLFKITHEIKNPLAVCKGYFDMLDFNNIKKVEKYIGIIREEVNHALLIINDFSDLSKIKVEKEMIDIDMVIDDTLSSLKDLFYLKKIKYEYEGHEIYINADYKRLMQVFINIIKNSVEAMDKVNNKLVSIKLKENKNSIIIEFLDNGKGMDEEVFKNFKNPFYTTKTYGTGLGTVLSNEIIKAHNGTIKYSSILNKGTNVIIELPKNSY